MTTEPERGSVRLTGGPLKHGTLVEVFDGAAWIRLRGVTEVGLDLAPPYSGPVRLKLTVLPHSFEIIAGQVNLERAPDPV